MTRNQIRKTYYPMPSIAEREVDTTRGSIVHLGATPVLVFIWPDSYLSMDPKQVEACGHAEWGFSIKSRSTITTNAARVLSTQ